MQDITLLTVQGPRAQVYATEVKLQGDGVSSRAAFVDDPFAALLLESTPLPPPSSPALHTRFCPVCQTSLRGICLSRLAPYGASGSAHCLHPPSCLPVAVVRARPRSTSVPGCPCAVQARQTATRAQELLARRAQHGHHGVRMIRLWRTVSQEDPQL